MKNRKLGNASKRHLYRIRMHAAVCTACGLPNDRPHRCRCSVCAAKQAARDAARYARTDEA